MLQANRVYVVESRGVHMPTGKCYWPLCLLNLHKSSRPHSVSDKNFFLFFNQGKLYCPQYTWLKALNIQFSVLITEYSLVLSLRSKLLLTLLLFFMLLSMLLLTCTLLFPSMWLRLSLSLCINHSLENNTVQLHCQVAKAQRLPRRAGYTHSHIHASH